MSGISRVMWEHRKGFAYLVLTLTLMICLSHGTQDLYPDFLKTAHHISPNVVAYLAMIYNVGALLGTISVGAISERLGRRLSVIGSLDMRAGYSAGRLAYADDLGIGAFNAVEQGARGSDLAHLMSF
jgi:MFS family permease